MLGCFRLCVQGSVTPIIIIIIISLPYEGIIVLLATTLVYSIYLFTFTPIFPIKNVLNQRSAAPVCRGRTDNHHWITSTMKKSYNSETGSAAIFMISRLIYGLLLVMDIRDNDILGNSKSHYLNLKISPSV